MRIAKQFLKIFYFQFLPSPHHHPPSQDPDAVFSGWFSSGGVSSRIPPAFIVVQSLVVSPTHPGTHYNTNSHIQNKTGAVKHKRQTLRHDPPTKLGSSSIEAKFARAYGQASIPSGAMVPRHMATFPVRDSESIIFAIFHNWLMNQGALRITTFSSNWGYRCLAISLALFWEEINSEEGMIQPTSDFKNLKMGKRKPPLWSYHLPCQKSQSASPAFRSFWLLRRKCDTHFPYSESFLR